MKKMTLDCLGIESLDWNQLAIFQWLLLILALIFAAVLITAYRLHPVPLVLLRAEASHKNLLLELMPVRTGDYPRGPDKPPIICKIDSGQSAQAPPGGRITDEFLPIIIKPTEEETR